jgi:hypothetical protein
LKERVAGDEDEGRVYDFDRYSQPGFGGGNRN